MYSRCREPFRKPSRLPTGGHGCQSVWKHDIYYSSKVMGDKVMLIQMNNGERKFYESQIEPLKKDIETARENGYIVLLFMHETIYTKNRNETAVNALRVNDSGWAFNEDFCSNTANHHVAVPTWTAPPRKSTI